MLGLIYHNRNQKYFITYRNLMLNWDVSVEQWLDRLSRLNSG